MLVVDDNLPDGTATIVENLVIKYRERLRILTALKNRRASTVLQTFEWGMRNSYNAMLKMDADFSHDPKYISQIVAKADECDVVIGSRFMEGHRKPLLLAKYYFP